MITGPKNLARYLKRRVTKLIARRRFENSIRPSDIFIVTYPKSGTIWLSFLIANIIKSDPTEKLTFRNFFKYVPDINDLYFKNGSLREFSSKPDPRFFYVHAPYDSLFPKVVYVLRDPRDVMVSYYHFKCLTNSSFCCSIQEFIASENHFPCEWDEHVAGWLFNRDSHLCLVRYEEMHKDTASTVKRVLDFVGLSYTMEDILHAVEASRFERMRSLEEKHGIQGSEEFPKTNERFVRRGKVGGWRNELDKECVRIIEQKYGDVMHIVGYELSS